MSYLMKSETISSIGTGCKDYTLNADSNIIPVIRSHQLRYAWGGYLFDADPSLGPLGVIVAVTEEKVEPFLTTVYEMPDDTYFMDSMVVSVDKNVLILGELVEYPSLDAAIADPGDHSTADKVVASSYGFQSVDIRFNASYPMAYGKCYVVWIWQFSDLITGYTTYAHGIRDIVVQR